MRQLITFLSCMIYGITVWGQSVFPLPTPIIQEGDSLYQEYYSDEFYSAFTRTTYKDTSGSKFRFRSATTKAPSSNGYLIISKDSCTLQKMTILGNRIEGIGMLYQDACYPYKYSYIYCQALFRDGVLEGPASLFYSNGEVKEVFIYRKGNYIRHLYNYRSFSRESLKYTNKYDKRDPLKYEKFFLDEVD